MNEKKKTDEATGRNLKKTIPKSGASVPSCRRGDAFRCTIVSGVHVRPASRHVEWWSKIGLATLKCTASLVEVSGLISVTVLGTKFFNRIDGCAASQQPRNTITWIASFVSSTYNSGHRADHDCRRGMSVPSDCITLRWEPTPESPLFHPPSFLFRLSNLRCTQ